VRLFVAVVPPADVIEDLESFVSVRRESAAFRWTTPDQWHLTLAFMASVAERHLDDLVERLARASGKRAPFDLAIRGGGAFPNVGRAKVLFADVVADGPDLPHLATGVRAACAKAGAEPGGGRFRGHLTLARLGRPQELTNWVRLLEGYDGPRWTVDEFVLVQSHLGEGPRKRPRYEVLDTFPLGGSSPRRGAI
jgi:2'-5' RNA ligase